MKTLLFVIGILIPLISIGTFIISKENGQKITFSPYVHEKGGISLPKDFRNNWTHLGAWALPNNTAEGFHDVFTQPGTVEGYKKNNKCFQHTGFVNLICD